MSAQFTGNLIAQVLALLIHSVVSVARMPRGLWNWYRGTYVPRKAEVFAWLCSGAAVFYLALSPIVGSGYIVGAVGFFLMGGAFHLHLGRMEAGQTNSQFLAKRVPCPWGKAKANAVVDVATSRGQTVVRGSSVQVVNEAPKIDPMIVQLGGVVVDPKDEPKHLLCAGRTGSGKSQAIYSILKAVIARNNPTFIADPGGSYLSRYGKSDALVLNPFDRRDAGWSPFSEIEQEYDCQRLAKAAIPDGEGEQRQWQFYAQTLLSELLRIQWLKGNHSIAELLRLAQSADAQELSDLLANTPAEAMVSGHADRMLGSTRSIIATYLAGWRYLSDDAARNGVPGFSVRQWMRKAASGPAPWLFAVYRDDQLALLRNMIACWLDVAIIELLSSSENPNRRVWFIADELDSLGKVGALRDGLTKLRKYGGVVVAGLQTIAQLRSTYGRDEAQVLLSCLSTKVTLAAGDAETAEYFEKQLGKQEIERIQRSGGNSSNLHGGSNSANWTRQQQVQSTVLASEIATLSDLHGFVQLASGGIGRVVIPYTNLPQNIAAFEPKTRGARA